MSNVWLGHDHGLHVPQTAPGDRRREDNVALSSIQCWTSGQPGCSCDECDQLFTCLLQHHTMSQTPAKGAKFLTEPKDHGIEIRAYMQRRGSPPDRSWPAD